MDVDEEDFVFYGTPIEREEEITSRKKKAVAEASGHLRTLVPWKQEVRDEEGRRRFHGAFTGGYSAGYYNTVGSKEGWTPQSFTSSRKNRAEVKQQNILNFLDDDERAELEDRSLGTSSQFDTFGFTAAEYARKQAEKEQQQRPSAIPGPVPDELVLPATESIGVKLLLKMGWRHGHSIRGSRANSLYDARREARKALLALSSDDANVHCIKSEPGEDDLGSLGLSVNDDVQTSRSTPVFVLNPKQDLYGLGYDPYKHAPEFREKKRSRVSDNREPGNRKALLMRDGLFGFKSGKAAPGFGIGALEEYDAEDEDLYGTAYDFEETCVEEVEEPARISTDHKQKLVWKEQGVLPGFRVASNSDYQLERFDPPVIPKDFVPHHKFPGSLQADDKHTIPPPPEVPPPDDNNLKLLIEGVATLVARCGKLFEDLSRDKNQSNPLFSFLNGGNGHEYYARKLWEECQKCNDQKHLALDGKSSSSVQRMTAESRANLLGEKPLERSLKENTSSVASADFNLQFNLSDTFIKPASYSELPEVAKPFKDDPAKQERFEQFLKEKYYGGLRSMDSVGASNMSEAARARERLDFEAAAEAIEKGKGNKETKLSAQQFMAFSTGGGTQFTSGGLEQVKDAHAEDLLMKKIYPKREEFQWRPLPILCKRFDLIDPYMGKPPPPPRMRSKLDSLIFTSDSVKPTKLEETTNANRDRISNLQSGTQKISKDAADSEKVVEVQVENVERPVDLYKAIFSDDSDDEVEASTANKVEDPDKKVEVAHTTLNRLIAGDFLESLGKELGLEVPPDMPYSTNKTGTSTSKKDSAIANTRDVNILPIENKSSSNPNASNATYRNEGVHQEIAKGSESLKNESAPRNPPSGSSRYMEHGGPNSRVGVIDLDKTSLEDSKAKSPRSRHRKLSGSSSEDEKSRKHSRRHRYSSSDSYSESSSDDWSRHHSRSKGRKKGSSRERKSSSKKHSKRHKHRSRDSPERSHLSTEKERAGSKREKRKWRD
ncbi:RNA binding protein, putative [Ricinus communis]|uniref:RNA binding protein, putative n=1 Tax=Ricinus communis TaxID=3988 RepID=B9RE60_RICCO|nr:RNA binding protein, putative [Ricinus communis]|eukprot:XP_002511999.1 G patch domain-containing protein TGH [Ricinus communis]